MLTWYRDLERAERVKIGRYSEQVFRYLGAGSSIESLYEYFRVTVRFPRAADEPYQLDLDPKYERIAKRLRSMTVWIDRRSFLPTRFRYVQRDGDTTEYEMVEVVRNGELAADTFELELPAGVEVRTVDLEQAARP
jgi:outer membrane lipoprotein-sorting protein